MYIPIKPEKSDQHNCLENILVCLALYYGFPKEYVYMNSWNFSFDIYNKEVVIGPGYREDEFDFLVKYTGLIIKNIRKSEFDTTKRYIYENLIKHRPIIAFLDEKKRSATNKYVFGDKAILLVGLDDINESILYIDPINSNQILNIPIKELYDFLLHYSIIDYQKTNNVIKPRELCIRTLSQIYPQYGAGMITQIIQFAEYVETNEWLNYINSITDFLNSPLFISLSQIISGRKNFAELIKLLAFSQDDNTSEFLQNIYKLLNIAANKWVRIRLMLFTLSKTGNISNLAAKIKEISLFEENILRKLENYADVNIISSGNKIIEINIQAQDKKYIYDLSKQLQKSEETVCLYLYMLLLYKYTGFCKYKTGTNTKYIIDQNKSVLNCFIPVEKDVFLVQADYTFSVLKEEDIIPEYEDFIKISINNSTIKIQLRMNEITASAPPFINTHYSKCIKSLVLNKDSPSKIEILDSVEKKKLYDMQRGRPIPLSLPLLSIDKIFTSNVKKYNQEIAVEMNGIKKTYGELDALSNRAASVLQSNGINSNDIVAVIMDTSIELIAWIIGIMKIGGVYLPIDPDNPVQRILHMINDCDAKCAIIDPQMRDTYKLYEKSMIKEISSALSNITIDKYKYNYRAIDSLAYIIYTSGTTGSPNGVKITHSNLLHQLMGLAYWGGFTERTSSLLSANNAFDVSLQQIFLPLILGGIIYILPKEIKLSARKVIQYINQRNITIVNMVPQYLESLLDCTQDKMECDVLLVGGDIFHFALLDKIKRKTTAKKVCNIYGLSETTINASIYTCSYNKTYHSIPIGCPLPYYCISIHNINGELVPIGIPGEIFIGGKGVSQGYIGNLSKTQEKFGYHKLNIKQKFYRTGDKAKWCIDGNIQYIDRIDRQVKLNGKRVELQEIEQVIMMLEQVQATAVLLDKKRNLIAFIVAQKELSVYDVKNHLSENLVEYMIPKKIIFVKEIPLMRNGKIDRKILTRFLQ